VAATQEELVAQRVAREAVLCDHVYAAKLELTPAGTGVVQTLAQSLIDSCKRLLHTKIKDGSVISGYYGAATHGYNLVAIEALHLIPLNYQGPQGALFVFVWLGLGTLPSLLDTLAASSP
jgi:hypothetical protein